MTYTRRDWITDLGIGTVGLAAAILTFTTLTELGVRVGFTGSVFGFHLAWLLPIVIDAAGVVAARVWLRALAAADAITYARRLALSCIGISVVFNGGLHLLDAARVTSAPWWVVLPVTSVPPAVLAAVVHLGHLLHRAPVDQSTPVAGPVTIETVDRAEQVQLDRAPDRVEAVTGPVTEAVQTEASGPVTVPAEWTADASPDQRSHTTTVTDEAVLKWLRERAQETGHVPGRKAVRDAFPIGAGRADSLRGQVTAPRRIRRVK